MTRLENVRAKMRAEGVDLVVLGPQAHLSWLTGLRPYAHERPFLMCITATYAGILIPALEADGARRQTDLPLHEWRDDDGPQAAFAALLKAAGATNAASLVLDETMRADFAGLVQEALPKARRQFTASTIGMVRMRKDADEYAALKRNAQIADTAMRTAWAQMAEGMTEADVAAIILQSFKNQNATLLFEIVGAAGNGALPHHHTGDAVLKAGDAIVMDIGASVEGYSSDMTRMAIMGSPPTGYQDVHAVVEAAVQAALAAARPGVKAHVVDDAARNVITAAGYGDYFVHRTGHGMGVEIHEQPYITSTSQTMLEEGMVFSIEPGIYLPDRFGIRLEEIVILRADGPEILSDLPRTAQIITA